MKKNYLLLLPIFGYFLSGCEAIGTIFKSGVWTGIILVVGALVLVVFLFSRRKK